MTGANEILEEIWRVREELARESNHDLHAMAEAAREREARLAAQGWKLVSFAEAATRDEVVHGARGTAKGVNPNELTDANTDDES